MTRSNSSVGINLANVDYYSTEFPFIDRMKTAGLWIASGATAPVPLDKNGYPTGIPAGASSLYTLVGLDPASAGTSNIYQLIYTGTESFYLGGATILSSQPGKITFSYDNSTTNQMLIAIGGIDSTAPLGNMHIVRSDQVDLFNAGEIFNPAFTAKVSQLDTLRYMDWGDTNANSIQNWSDRTTLNSETWQSSGNNSVPIEAMVALANETKTNMWLNIPTQATDDYVKQEMTYVHDHLDPSLSVHLEYSNEVWNFQFQQAGYAAVQGAKLWDKDANGDGVIDQSDPAEHDAADWVKYYGYRAAQIASIANQVFGSDGNRLHNVLATQSAFVGLQDYIVQGIQRAGVGSVSNLFDDYAVTTYFGANMRGATDADKATIVAWAKAGDAGVTAAIAAIRDGTGLSSNSNSLASLAQTMSQQGAIAQSLGLKLVAYEGGQDMDAGAFGSNFALVDNFLKRVQADPRMGDLYKQMVSDFSAAGGTLDNALIDVDGGLYGTLKSTYDTGSPEWNALVMAQKAAVVATAPVAAKFVSTMPVTTLTAVSGTATVVATGNAATYSVGFEHGTGYVMQTGTVLPLTGVDQVAFADGTLSFDPNGLAASVYRTHLTAYGTVASADDLASGVAFLTSGHSVSDLASLYFGSPALIGASSLTNQQFVDQLYKNGLGRTADGGGEAFWTNQISSGSGTRAGVVAAIAQSDEAHSDTDAIVKHGVFAQGATTTAYEALYSRVPTSDELAAGKSLGLGEHDLLVQLASTSTFTNAVGNAYGDASPTHIVDYLYQNIVHRTADTGGEAFWDGLLTAPGETIGDIVYRMLSSDEAVLKSAYNTALGNGVTDIADPIAAGELVKAVFGTAPNANDPNFTTTLADLQNGATAVGEAQTLIANNTALTGSSTAQFIAAIYTTALGRPVDGSGAASWADWINNHGLSRAAFITDIVDSAEFQSQSNPQASILVPPSQTFQSLGVAALGGTGATDFYFKVGDLDADPTNTDTITNFSRADGDKIDLSAYDSSISAMGPGAFTFIGTAAFSNHAGEIRIDTSSANQVVCGDLNGDGVADFALNVSKGSGALIATDFVL